VSNVQSQSRRDLKYGAGVLHLALLLHPLAGTPECSVNRGTASKCGNTCKRAVRQLVRPVSGRLPLAAGCSADRAGRRQWNSAVRDCDQTLRAVRGGTLAKSPLLKSSRLSSVSGTASNRRRLPTVLVSKPGMGLSYACANTCSSAIADALPVRPHCRSLLLPLGVGLTCTDLCRECPRRPALLSRCHEVVCAVSNPYRGPTFSDGTHLPSLTSP